MPSVWRLKLAEAAHIAMCDESLSPDALLSRLKKLVAVIDASPPADTIAPAAGSAAEATANAKLAEQYDASKLADCAFGSGLAKGEARRIAEAVFE